MHTDKIIFSLIDTCRATRQKWQHEDEICVYQPGRGRSGPPLPVQIACDAFVDASAAMEGAKPKTLDGWFAKWLQIVRYETEFDYGDADYNLKMMQKMIVEFEALEAIAVA